MAEGESKLVDRVRVGKEQFPERGECGGGQAEQHMSSM